MKSRCKSWMMPAALVLLLSALSAETADADRHGPTSNALPNDGSRFIVWMADGQGMQPTGDLERFLVDRIGATGTRIVIDPEIAHSVLRVLGLQHRSVYDPAAVHQLAVSAQARWVLWVKIVARDMESKKLLGVPYLFNHRRLDAHVFFDVRLYDALLGEMIGSKRLELTDRGEGTWQVTEDERLDPIYNNDPVEIHGRFRELDWHAAALISGYCAGVLRPEHLATLEEKVRKRLATQDRGVFGPADPAATTAKAPD